MPRSFLLTNRRYIPTPPPLPPSSPTDDNVFVDNNNDTINANDDDYYYYYKRRLVDVDVQHSPAHVRHSCGSSEIEGGGDDQYVDESTTQLSNEMIVAHILLRQAEQTEAVNLAMTKPSRGHSITTTTTTTKTPTTTANTIPGVDNTIIDTTSNNINNNNNDINNYHYHQHHYHHHHTATNNNDNNHMILKDSYHQDSPPTFDNGTSVGAGVSCGLRQTVVATGEMNGDCRFYATSDSPPRPSVIFSVNTTTTTIANNNNNNNNGYRASPDVNLDSGCHDVGMDLSMKPDQRSPVPAACSTVLPDPETQDKAGLSDGDSDSGCSTQNEARSHLPPEVEYGWAECHAHFSLLYDLMTQGGRRAPGKEVDNPAYPTTQDGSESAPYDLSRTPTRDTVQEPPVLYELMTESPRKASGRDVPDHALEVEVPMQQYPPPPPHHHHQQFQSPVQHPQPPPSPQQLQQQQQQQPHKPYHPQQQQHPQAPLMARPQYDDHRRATLHEVAHDRGLVHAGNAPPAPRYEPRRSLNDLLFAAGLPPVSPPSPPALSPSASPLSAEENHSCDECGKRYSTSSNLARHRQTHRSHGDKKARKCPHCEKVYVSMPAFSMHVRTHNQGCACPHCGKRFSRPWLLQGHIRTHTGEKPFACPQCGKSFADKSNLRAHIQTHSSEKPYVCGRCGKAFALKSYLYKHEESSCMRGERFRPLRRQASADC